MCHIPLTLNMESLASPRRLLTVKAATSTAGCWLRSTANCVTSFFDSGPSTAASLSETILFSVLPLTCVVLKELTLHDFTTALLWLWILYAKAQWALLPWYGFSYPTAMNRITWLWVFLRVYKRFNRDTAHTTKCSSSVSPHSSPDLPAIPRRRCKVETKGEAGRL